MPTVQRSIPYTFDAYSGGVIKDPGRGKLPDLPPTTPTRLHQHLDPSGQQVLFDTVDVILPFFRYYYFYYYFIFGCSPELSIRFLSGKIPRLYLFYSIPLQKIDN
jgi:hypothetical protein